MAIKNKLFLFFITLHLIFHFPIITQEMSAQKYLELLESQNRIPDGYFEGEMEFLFPYKKKQQYDFIFLKKKEHTYWELKKNHKIHYKILCDRKYQNLYLYDKRRDVLINKKEKMLLQNWSSIPYFLFCGILLERMIDPNRIEKQNQQIIIRGKFFFPFSRKSIVVHANSDLQIKKYILYQQYRIQYRILFLYQYPITMLKQNQMEIVPENFPSRWEIIQAMDNRVVIIQWHLWNPDYKIDDIRFRPEFLSR